MTPVRIDPAGVTGPTPGQSRGPRWRQSSHGYYVPSTTSDDLPEQRALEQSARLPDHGAVTGWAACRLYGAAFFDGLAPDGATRTPVPLVVGPRSVLRTDCRVTVSRERLALDETVVVGGARITRCQRALFDEMRRTGDLRDAVVAMDMMAAAELVSIRQMREYAAVSAIRRGVPLVQRALDLADEESMSPNETRMRLIWVLDARLPRPLVNQPVFDLRGKLLGIADLLDPVAGVVGEYDGAAHRGARRHRKDVMREERFRGAGFEYFKVVGGDLPHPEVVVDRMLATRRRALDLPRRVRRWTLTPPEDWYDSAIEALPLDDRLALREEMHRGATEAFQRPWSASSGRTRSGRGGARVKEVEVP